MNSRNARLCRIAVNITRWGHEHDTATVWSYLRTDLKPADALTRQSWEQLRDLLPEGSERKAKTLWLRPGAVVLEPGGQPTKPKT